MHKIVFGLVDDDALKELAGNDIVIFISTDKEDNRNLLNAVFNGPDSLVA